VKCGRVSGARCLIADRHQPGKAWS
jgi:hypothetical protein